MEETVTAPASADTIQSLDDISDHVSKPCIVLDMIAACSFASTTGCQFAVTFAQCVLQLCQVYDAAEFCRNAHSNTEWRQQALQAVMVTASK